MNKIKPNSLINEKSPYLLQHAHNPVDWLPWGEEAFNKSIREDKPIFLSIGYSTCHWCHVMEKESFEDEDVARILNDSFISIKVDREERPDIDHIYMKVCQLMTGSGGWPLSVFLTPGKKPFFAGTYFPKENKYGRIGFVELLNRVSGLWKEKKYELTNNADEITSALSDNFSSNQNRESGKDFIPNTFKSFERLYDTINGGFGSAPKFPSPHNLLFLLRYWKKYKEPAALNIVNNTLTKMRLGGIFDQIGFGFHRYSTDSKWLVPHFEKMLYDQAMLIMAYSEAYQATRNDLFKSTVKEIIEYLNENLLSPEGGFYSAEDADSEGVEGKFYVWSLAEINNLLNADEAELFSKTYNITEHGNFNDESSGIMNGSNIPHLIKPVEDDNEKKLINSIRQKLISVRNKRIHPFKDDKILTDWNGLMIAALSTAANVFDNKEYLALALKCKDFVFSKMMINNYELNHRYRNGESGIPANLDDYAFLIWGLLSLYNLTFDEQHLTDAINLTDTVLNIFWDDNDGTFYFSNSASSDLVVRTKEFYDGAIPSGNSVMLHNLIMLSRITIINKYELIINRMVDTFSNVIGSGSSSNTFAISYFMFLNETSYELVIVGDKTNPETVGYIKELRKYFTPDMITIFKNSDTTSKIDYINNYKMINGQTTFYLCQNHACDTPTNDIAEILKKIS